MEAINFPQANLELAKDQPQFNTLPAFHGQIGESPEETGFVFAMKLSDEELNTINHTKTIWFSQMTYGRKFHPFSAWPDTPFDAPKEYEKEIFTKQELIDFGHSILMKYAPENEGVTDADFRNWLKD